MSRAGRKRKEHVERQPCGQIKRPPREESLETMRKFITSQPHRRGAENPTDQKHESAFGRFCVRLKLREQIFIASEHFAALVRRWRAAKGVPTNLRLGQGGSGEGPSDATVARWGQEIAAIEHGILANCDPRGYLSIRTMILDEIDADRRLDKFSTDAAFWLAVEIGTLSAKHAPFS